MKLEGPQSAIFFSTSTGQYIIYLTKLSQEGTSTTYQPRPQQLFKLNRNFVKSSRGGEERTTYAKALNAPDVLHVFLE